MAREKALRKSQPAGVKRRERRDTRPQEIVAAAFEEFAAKGYAGDQARGCRRPRAGEQGPALSLLQDQGGAVQGGHQERDHRAFRRDAREDGNDHAVVRGVSQGSVPLLPPGAGLLQARLHRAAADRRRAQASRAHRILLRPSGLARHRDADAPDRPRRRARRVSPDALARVSAAAGRAGAHRHPCGAPCSSGTITSTPTGCSPPISSS